MSNKSLSNERMTGLVPAIVLAIMTSFVVTSVAQETTDTSSAGECTTCDLASIDANAKPALKIRWKRLVDSTGQTAAIHSATEQGINAAVQTLKASLEPLGVEVVLQKADMTQEQFTEAPLNSNRIWLNGKLLETYLPDTKSGQVQDKESKIAFRTVNFGGTAFKDVPAKMIEHAGVIAAADSMKETWLTFMSSAWLRARVVHVARRRVEQLLHRRTKRLVPKAANHVVLKAKQSLVVKTVRQNHVVKPTSKNPQLKKVTSNSDTVGNATGVSYDDPNSIAITSAANPAVADPDPRRKHIEYANHDWPQWLGPKRDAVWRETGILTRLPEKPLEAVWRTKIDAGFSGPTVFGDKVFVTDFVKRTGVVNNIASGREKVSGEERVHALDLATGKILWTRAYPVEYSASYPEGPRTSPQVVGDKVYTVGTDGNLLCLSVETGDVIWSKDFKSDYMAETPFWGHSAHPLVFENTLICMVGAKDSVVVAFDLETGKERWKSLNAAEPGYASPTLAKFGNKTTLLVWHPESLNGINPVDGSVYWSLPLQARSGMSVTAPLVVNNKIYVSGIGTLPTLITVAQDGMSAKIDWQGHAKKGSLLATVRQSCSKTFCLELIQKESWLPAHSKQANTFGQRLNQPLVIDGNNTSQHFLFATKTVSLCSTKKVNLFLRNLPKMVTSSLVAARSSNQQRALTDVRSPGATRRLPRKASLFATTMRSFAFR